MPAASNITMWDRAATPVAHVFSPFGKDATGVVSYREAGSSPVADRVVTASYRKTGAGKYQTRAKLQSPVVQNSTVNGVTIPVVVRTGYFDVTLTFDPTSTVQERKDLVKELTTMFDYTVNPSFVDDVITANGGLY